MNTNLFGAPTLLGLRVRLDRPADRERPCCRNVCIIGAARGPHAGELTCTDCGQHAAGSANQPRNGSSTW
jgi:hypothetical protein